MSFQHKRVRRRITISEMHCDGPRHSGDTEMQCDSVTLSWGFGTTRDMQNHHFCSENCLKQWVMKNLKISRK